MRYFRSFPLPGWVRCLLAVAMLILVVNPIPGTKTAYAAPDAPAFSGCGGVEVGSQDPGFEARVVALTNARRAEAGLPPLKRVEGLDRAARYHAADMAQDDYFKHETYDRNGNDLVLVCDTWDRVVPYYAPPDWMHLGENIGLGYVSPEAVVQGWMDSAGHRENLLSPDNWEIGVGYWKGDGDWDHYWVQDFGRRDTKYPLVINSEAESTDGRNVSLYIYGTTGEWQELRLRNDTGNWGPWQPFTNELDWELEPQAGLRTVSVELRGPRGNAASQDTIQLTQDDVPNLPNAKYRLFLPLSRR